MTDDRLIYLQGMYVNGINNLTKIEMEEFLDYNKNHLTAAFREKRIMRIENELKRINIPNDHIDKERMKWFIPASKYAELTFKWEDLGAYWEIEGNQMYASICETVWKYKEVEFFRWKNNPDIIEMYERAKLADVELNKLIKGRY